MFDPVQFDPAIERRSLDREQRGALRLSLDPGEASLDTLGLDGVELVDVSVSGVGLLLPRDFDQHHHELGGVLRFGERKTAVRLEPMRVAQGLDVRRLGARFIDPTHQTLRELGDFLIEGFVRKERRLSHLWQARENILRFRSSLYVTELLRHKALRQATPIYVYRDGLPLRVRLYALGIHDAGGQQVLNTIPHGEDALHLSSGATYDFVLAGKKAASLFSSTIVQASTDSVIIAIPTEIRQCGFRASGRRRLPETESIPVAAPHSRNQDECISGFLLDVSVGGFSFILQHNLDPLLPGDQLPRLSIELPVGCLTVSAIVRRVAGTIQDTGRECGIEILKFSSDSDRDLWERFVFERLHPRSLANEPYIVKAAWQLLDASEYLRLWTPNMLRDHLELSFFRSWSQVDKNCGHLTILTDGNRDIGTLAASRIYPRTWLLHSLGIDKERRSRTRFFFDVARDVYDAILHLVQHSQNSEYFVLYAEKSKRLTKLLYGDFVDAHSDATAMLYDEYRLFKRRTDNSAYSPPIENGISIEVLRGRQLHSLSRLIERKVSHLEFDAFSYAEQEIDLGLFGEQFINIGSDRSRGAIVALRGTTPLAALVADVGDEGANVFGLLNRCRIIWFSDVIDRQNIKGALLTCAVTYYRDAGKLAFVYIDRDGEGDDVAAELGYDFVSEGIRWLARANIMPAWRSYIEDIMGLKGDSYLDAQPISETFGANLNAIQTECG
jgi:hypothetical protein